MLADCELSQFLVHSQICEDERIAYALQMQLIGCDETSDVVDGLVVEVAAAHNALAAAIFAKDASLAEKDSVNTRALDLAATDDADMAREIHEAEVKKEALARLDRELAQQIDQMPNRLWQEGGEQTHHPDVDLASRIVHDVVATEQELDVAAQGRLAKRLAAELSDSEFMSQEAAFASIDACKASKTGGKAILTARIASASGSSGAVTSLTPPGHGLSTLSALTKPFAPAESGYMSTATPDDNVSTRTQCMVCDEDGHEPAAKGTSLSKCMACFEYFGSAQCVFPMVPRQPQIGDLILARYRPHSLNWKSAIVLRTSPAQVKQPWVAVTFEGFADEVVIPAGRLQFAPASAHAASVWEDDGSMGWACGHALCSGCFEPYLTSLVSIGRPEVACCQPECNGAITIEQCIEVLGSTPIILKLRQMQNEAALTHKVFCTNNKCGAVFDAVYATLGVNGVRNWPKVQCPRCCMGMCADCHVPWHQGVKCDSFQKIPDDFRDQADLDLLRLAAEQQFRKCPSCCELVEKRVGDCNWIECRCSCKFCYGCGVRYKKHKPTANNVHGTPGCKCGLFDDVKPHEDVAAVILGSTGHSNKATKVRKVSRPDGPYRPGKDKAKFKNNMDVLPVPCKFSRTNAGSPRGKKCWYKHQDDD